MKYASLFIMCLFCANVSYAQDYVKRFYQPEVIPKNNIDNVLHHDFSHLWLNNINVLGIIGDNHQRLQIKILDIKKNPNNAKEYLVTGKSKVKNNICDFAGKIILKNVFDLKTPNFGVDNMYKNTFKKQGFVGADYIFYENKQQKLTGIFKGELYSRWLLDNNNKMRRDITIEHSDGAINNAFIGTWQSYQTKQKKLAHWANLRVPKAHEDFDIGAGEFSPNKQYYKYGWENYAKASAGDEKAQIKEQKPWW